MFDIITWKDETLDQHDKIQQDGTLYDEVNMNRIEAGIYEGGVLGAALIKEAMHTKKTLADLEGEIGQIVLSNKDDFPFNNSVKTIAIKKNRDTDNYRVVTEIVSSSGEVGGIIIGDKLLNGFKIEFTGSAKSVTIKYFIQGGMYQ